MNPVIGALYALSVSAAGAAADIQTIRVLDMQDTQFPFFVQTNALINAVPDLAGQEIVSARMSFELTLNPGSNFDVLGAEFSMRAPIFGPSGEDTFAQATFLGSEFLLVTGDTASGFIETDLLNGEIRNNTQIGGGKGKGNGKGGELIPAASFDWTASAPGFEFGDPSWATLTSLVVEIDVRPVPTPGALPMLVTAGLIAARRRRG